MKSLKNDHNSIKRLLQISSQITLPSANSRSSPASNRINNIVGHLQVTRNLSVNFVSQTANSDGFVKISEKNEI